jgi:hypothetical protein
MSSVIAVYKDFNGRIKKGWARNKWEAFSLYHTFFDPGILVHKPNGMPSIIPGPRQQVLYIFKIKEKSFGML